MGISNLVRKVFKSKQLFELRFVVVSFFIFQLTAYNSLDFNSARDDRVRSQTLKDLETSISEVFVILNEPSWPTDKTLLSPSK